LKEKGEGERGGKGKGKALATGISGLNNKGVVRGEGHIKGRSPRNDKNISL